MVAARDGEWETMAAQVLLFWGQHFNWATLLTDTALHLVVTDSQRRWGLESPRQLFWLEGRNTRRNRNFECCRDAERRRIKAPLSPGRDANCVVYDINRKVPVPRMNILADFRQSGIPRILAEQSGVIYHHDVLEALWIEAAQLLNDRGVLCSTRRNPA